MRDLIVDRLIDDFNSMQFESCMRAVEWVELRMDLSMAPEVASVRPLVDFYEAWDRFDHERADRLAKQVKESEKTWRLDTNKNRYAVHTLAQGKAGRAAELLSGDDCALLLGDVYANALRRGKEGRYDDAVASLYRLTELIAQQALMRDFGVSTSSVDRGFLEDRGLLEKCGGSVNRRGDVQLMLYRAYELLKDLGSEAGGLYLDNPEFQRHIVARNESILAHGFAPVGREVFEKLSVDVRNACSVVMSEQRFESALACCQFPTLCSTTR